MAINCGYLEGIFAPNSCLFIARLKAVACLAAFYNALTKSPPTEGPVVSYLSNVNLEWQLACPFQPDACAPFPDAGIIANLRKV